MAKRKTPEPAPRIVAVGSEFDKYFGKTPPAPEERYVPNMWWRVLVSKNIPPRDEMFEYTRDMGSPHLEALLKGEPIPAFGGHLTLYFPERWMSVQEQTAFHCAVICHPQVAASKLTTVDVVTMSPMLIGGFHREEIVIISKPEHEDTANEIMRRYDAFKKREKAA